MAPSQIALNLQQAFKIALSMTLLYWLALSLNWDLPKYGALAIALISLDTTGASLQKGLMRIGGTAIGLAVGMLGLALFAQDSWLMLAFLACYLLFVSYFLQTSRYPYAWFVAGFLTPLVWATTYGKIDSAFSYATFRYLETTAGVVIYTAISALFWPRRAGATLVQQGEDFCRQLHALFSLYRCQLVSESDPAHGSSKRTELAGIASQIALTLDAAYVDTPSVVKKRRAWESFGVKTQTAVDSLELWRQCFDDCRHLDLDRWLLDLPAALDHLEQRLGRIESLWQSNVLGEDANDHNHRDESLVTLRPLKLAEDPAGKLSHLDRAALLCFIKQLNLFDRAGVDLLRTMRVLKGSSSARELNSHWLPSDPYHASRWDPARIGMASLPTLCFVLAWLLWVYYDPPAGPSSVSQAATFGLLLVMSPINMLKMIPLILVSILGFIAPVYFLVMPRLSTGPELLTLVFTFAFTVSVVLVGRLTVLRTLLLACFVSLTNINNEQQYSFNGLVDGMVMLMLSIGVVAIVQAIVTPLKPEEAFLKSARSFFRGCTRIIDGYTAPSGVENGRQRRLRKRWFESMVLPGPAKARAAARNLEHKQHPDKTLQQVQQLIDAMQSVANRLRTLEIAHQSLVGQTAVHPPLFTVEASRLRKFLKEMSESCERLDSGTAFKDQRAELRQVSTDLQRQFDRLSTSQGQDAMEDSQLANLYATMGAVRGLIEAMGTAQDVIGQIRWDRLATPRF